MLGALFAVPTAAAYAIGPSDRVFSGFWGIGFNFWPILTSRLSYIGVLGGFALFTVIFFIPEVSLRSLIHLAQSAFTGQTPDLINYPISEPKFETRGAQIALMLWIVFNGYLLQPFWLATAALSFRLALEQEEARDAADTPCPDTRRAQEDAERAKTVNLRKARMPARWHRPKSKRPSLSLEHIAQRRKIAADPLKDLPDSMAQTTQSTTS